MMNPSDIYLDEVLVERKASALSGPGTEKASLKDLITSGPMLLREWAKDNDIPQITVVSTNIGFVRTYTKQYKPRD